MSDLRRGDRVILRDGERATVVSADPWGSEPFAYVETDRGARVNVPVRLLARATEEEGGATRETEEPGGVE